MVEIPDRLIAEHVITQAREYGDWGGVQDTVYEGKHGQAEYETDWSLTDIDPSECDVDIHDDTVVVHAMVEAEYSVQVSRARYNPPGKAHPAEYERRTAPLMVEITMELGDLPVPKINAQIG